jgi:hypothetical protein
MPKDARPESSVTYSPVHNTNPSPWSSGMQGCSRRRLRDEASRRAVCGKSARPVRTFELLIP